MSNYSEIVEMINKSSTFVKDIQSSPGADKYYGYIKGDLVEIHGQIYEYVFDHEESHIVKSLSDYSTTSIRDVDVGNIKLIRCPIVENVYDKYFQQQVTESLYFQDYTYSDTDVFKSIDLKTVPHHPQDYEINIVYDMVHPSRYITPFKVTSENKSEDIFKRPYIPSNHRWISNRVVSGKIIDEIPHMKRSDNAVFYNYLEALLSQMMPHFNKCWKYVQAIPKYKSTDNVTRMNDTKEPELTDLPENLQFYLKAVDIEIDETYHGVWHLEGMAQEHIVASGLYYPPSPIESEILFKRVFTPTETIDLWETIGQSHPSSLREVMSQNYMPLGNIKIPKNEGKILVFPNTHVHKVQAMINENYDQHEHRKVIAFFLVDPTIKTVPDYGSVKQKDILETMSLKDKHTLYHDSLLENMMDRKRNKDSLNLYNIEFCEH